MSESEQNLEHESKDELTHESKHESDQDSEQEESEYASEENFGQHDILYTRYVIPSIREEITTYGQSIREQLTTPPSTPQAATIQSTQSTQSTPPRFGIVPRGAHMGNMGDIDAVRVTLPVVFSSEGDGNRTYKKYNSETFYDFYNKDASDMLIHNNKFRRYDVSDGEGSDLIDLDQFNQFMPCFYLPTEPTFIPCNDSILTAQRSTRNTMSQEEFNEDFKDVFGPVMEILKMNDDVVVAGGSPGSILHFEDEFRDLEHVDVDIFLIKSSEENLWNRLAKILFSLHKLNGKPKDSSVTYYSISLTKGVCNIRAHGGRFHGLKMQVVLRVFPSLSALLHGFDLPSSCIAYDGEKTYFSTLGAWSHRTGLNIVNPSYRSTTYEYRLWKYFNHRGFGIVFPLLKRWTCHAGEIIKLPFLDLQCLGVVPGGLLCCGKILGDMSKNPPPSDYDGETGGNDTAVNLFTTMGAAKRNSLIYNTYQLHGHSRQHEVMGVPPSPPHAGNQFYWSLTSLPKNMMGTIDSLTSLSRGCITLADILPLKTLNTHLDSLEKGRSIKMSNLKHIDIIQRVYDLTKTETEQLTSAILNQVRTDFQNSDKAYINVHAFLQPHRLRLLKLYEERKKEIIEWWITIDPSRQYTASLNPVITDPAVWYGNYFSSPTEDSKHETKQEYKTTEKEEVKERMTEEQMKLFMGDTSANSTEQICGLCFTQVNGDGNNIVRLQCGHTFHFSLQNRTKENECQGILSWFKKRSTCPNCRDKSVTNPKKYRRRHTLYSAREVHI